tara:strand:- start:42264 stop:42440 length:177 start_codon:yes stop_codon:yes gene_type:complete
MINTKCDKCGSENITTKERLRRIGGPQVKGRKMSYGYKLEIHYCDDCPNQWDGKELKL